MQLARARIPHARRARFSSRRAVLCPICGHADRDFADFNGRQQAQCRGCKSMERHRMLWIWLTRSGALDGDIRSVAHFAPEPAIAAGLKSLLPKARYVTADIVPGRAEETVDVTGIPWADKS